MLFLVAGYGRRPHYALWWSVGVICIGMLVFRHHRMEPVKQEESGHNPPRGKMELDPAADGSVKQEESRDNPPGKKDPKYHPFWYSFDLFVPGIGLHAADQWRPKEDRRFAQWYMRAHKILGWILIPLCVAAWTGRLIK